jgi:FkbM family methyltransferase
MLNRIDGGVRPAKQKAQKLSWFARLQHKLKIKSRKFRRPKVIGIQGIKIEVDHDRFPKSIVRALYRERYEDREAELVRQTLRRGDRVLEIGAGIGFISLICAQRCGADAVLSYEANPDNERFILRNFALNNLFPQFRSRAVSVAKGEAVLFVEPNFLSTGLISRGNGTKTAVQCDAIADVIWEFRPNCIVMDVEGAEIDLLPAAPLDGVTKIILETHPHVVGSPAIRELDAYLQSQGFACPNPDSGKVCLYLREAGPSLVELHTAV